MNCYHLIFMLGRPKWLRSKEPASNAGDVRDSGSIPGSGRSPGEGNGTPLQYSCLENPMDRGVRWATVHGVTKSQTRLTDWALIFMLHSSVPRCPSNGVRGRGSTIDSCSAFCYHVSFASFSLENCFILSLTSVTLGNITRPVLARMSTNLCSSDIFSWSHSSHAFLAGGSQKWC